MHSSLLAFVGVLLPLAQGGQDDLPVLSVGEPVTGEVAGEAPEVHTPTLDSDYTTAPTVGIRYLIQVDKAGPYHIELRSYDFDAYLILEVPGGDLLAEDDDGLIGLHSRVVFEAEAGVSYVATVCALHGLRGTYQVWLVAGQLRLDARDSVIDRSEVRWLNITPRPSGQCGYFEALRAEALSTAPEDRQRFTETVRRDARNGDPHPCHGARTATPASGVARTTGLEDVTVRIVAKCCWTRVSNMWP